MKHTIRFIILLFSLVMTGVSDVWADITENDIIINVLPNKAAGTVSVTKLSGMTVTITATPATGYTIDAGSYFGRENGGSYGCVSSCTRYGSGA